VNPDAEEEVPHLLGRVEVAAEEEGRRLLERKMVVTIFPKNCSVAASGLFPHQTVNYCYLLPGRRRRHGKVLLESPNVQSKNFEKGHHLVVVVEQRV
jgi:hypothetical protein